MVCDLINQIFELYQKFSLYVHTTRYLKPVQIYGRLFFVLHRPKPDLAPAPKRSELQGPWVTPALRKQSLVGPVTFDHLNQKFSLPNDGAWDVDGLSRLWNYHLHYFDDLMAEGFLERRGRHQDLVQSWIRHNPPAQGTGWEPYPLSRRVVNWIKADLTSSFLDNAALSSLAVQARYLTRRCERHLQGNHLWINAKALIFAGLFFDGAAGPGEAGKWLAQGMLLAGRGIKDQVKPDGSHYEQSPMYHAYMVEDLLDLINLGRACAWAELEGFKETAARMLGYLRVVCHPDGQIVLFNDAAFNMGPSPGQLLDYGQHLGIGPVNVSEQGEEWSHYPDSGVVCVKAGPWTLFWDTGPIGPDHIPGHAHADSLTLELSWNRQRVIVDTGTGEYGVSPERLHQRGTSAHNTVMIDGRNSSEVWAGFRVARRARPLGRATITHVDGQIICRAGHDGYKRLRGNVLHWRKIIIDKENIVIEDKIQGKGQHLAELFWQFHPEIDVRQSNDKWFLIHAGLGKIGEMTIQGAEDIQLLSATYHPEFGLSLETKKLVAKTRGSLPIKFLTRISSFNSQ